MARDYSAEYAKRKAAGTTPTASRERAPKGRTRAPSVAALRKDVASILEMANSLAFAIGLASDALTPEEIELLANGVAHELHAHPEWVRKLEAMMGGVSAHGVFAAAVLAIALPRLSRRGVIPWTVAQPLTGMAYMIGGSTPNVEGTKRQSDYDTFPVEAVPTPGPSGGQRFGEVDASGEVTGE